MLALGVVGVAVEVVFFLLSLLGKAVDRTAMLATIRPIECFALFDQEFVQGAGVSIW